MRLNDGTSMSNLVDCLAEKLTRRLAQKSARRSMLGRIGAWLSLPVSLPVLPIVRATAAESEKKLSPDLKGFALNAQTKDSTVCSYWRYCAIDGFLCSTCGGGVHSCPPGTSPSPTSWIGTCVNPDNAKSYLVAYRDCCGQDSCSQTGCLGTEGEQPTYRPQTNNDIVWCFGSGALVYNCSTAVIVGVAT